MGEMVERICQICATQVTTNVPRCPHQEATHCRVLGGAGQPGEWAVGVRNAACLPHSGRRILRSWRWEKGDRQHQKTKRCEITVIYIILKFPDKPLDTCFMFPEPQKSFFTESFSLLSWSMLPITVGLQIWSKKKSILCDLLTPIHHNDRWL